MAATVSRDVSIVYAGLTVGGTSDYVIDGPFFLELTYAKIEVGFHVQLNSDISEAAFLTLEAALLAAFRTPRGTINVSLGSTNRGGTGFDAEPTISKTGSSADTGQSARYTCHVVARRTADLSGQSGRFDSRSGLVTPSNGLRVLTLTGQYTSLNNNTALQQYTSAINLFCSARLTLFGLVNVEILHDTVEVHDSNNVADFVRVYQEVVHRQSLSLLDEPALKDTSLLVTRGDLDGGASDLAASPATEFAADYHANVDATVSTSLSTLWDTKVKALLISEIQAKASGVLVLTSVVPKFDVARNMISASVTGMVYGSSLVDLQIETEDAIVFGLVLLPVWDGNPFSRDVQPAIGRHLRTVTITKVTQENNPALAGYGNPDDLPNMNVFVEIERVKQRSRSYKGIRNASGGIVGLLTERTTRTYERAEAPAGPVADATKSKTSGGAAGRVATGQVDEGGGMTLLGDFLASITAPTTFSEGPPIILMPDLGAGGSYGHPGMSIQPTDGNFGGGDSQAFPGP